jgi:6-phosphogluconolactonase
MRAFVYLLVILFSLPLFGGQYVYVSAKGDKTLDVYQFNSSNGKLTLKEKFSLKGAPGNSVLSPDEKYLYVSVQSGTKRMPETGIETLVIQANGSLKSIGYGKTPQFCGFLAMDSKGQYLFSSHYREGKISSYKVENGIYKGRVLDDIKTDKNAHCIRVDRTDSFVYVPHTSPNKMYQFSFKNEKLTKIGQGYVDGPAEDQRYHEPRHMVFHPTKNFVYTSNERGGGLSHWTYDAQGSLTLKQAVSTLPDDNNKKFAASDITISADGRFVYVANRDNLDRNNPVGKDCLAAYALDPSTGEILKKVGSFAVGRHPRCVRIDTTGNYLFGPGVNNSTITVFKRDQNSGALKALETYKKSTNPMWVVTLEK